MKITVVMPLAEQRGGAELMLIQLIREAQGIGIDWTVTFLKDGPMVTQLAGVGARVRVIRAGRLREPWRFGRTVIELARDARQDGTDVVFGWMPKAQIYAGLAALIARTPSAWYQHGIPSPREWIDRVATLLPALGVVACSQAAARAQARLRPARQIMVVYPGADLARFDPSSLPDRQEARRRLGLPSSGPIIGIVGRLQRWKGIHLLVEAMPELLRSHPGAICLIVGGTHDLEPTYLQDLQNRISQLGLAGSVIMAGLQHDLPQWMQAMDILVHASSDEPFGIVVIEAMALGKPVVASNRGGPGEVITDGVNGLLWPYPDINGLVDALRRCLDEPGLAERVGSAARSRARQFSSKACADNFVAALQDLLGRPRDPATVSAQATDPAVRHSAGIRIT